MVKIAKTTNVRAKQVNKIILIQRGKVVIESNMARYI